MKIPKTFLLLFAAFAAVGALTPQHARADVTVSYFYDTLDPYGEWVQTADYGYVWHPTGVDDNWAPYTDGYWAYTDAGWTWVSYEDYGGVVYHYGRWAHMPEEGWVWVPGNTWAPAWVSWRMNDDYVGWAPLPPEAHWRAGMGFSTWVDGRFDIGPGFYSFVGVRDFGAPALGAVILSRDRNVDFIGSTTNITNITVNNSNVYVGGPSYERLAARSSRAIPTLKLVRQGESGIRGAGGKALSRQQGNQLVVLAPKITPSTGGKLTPKRVAKTLTSAKADHGWDGVKDPAVREKLHAQIKDQSTGTGSAKAVNPDDLKAVDEKIKSQGAGTKTVSAEATPKVPKTSKAKKQKSTEDLLNAPATEETGAATAEATPKSKKGKKSHTASESSFLDSTGAGSEATPGKTPKSKKAKTPKSDSELQPFMSNGDESAPKARKNNEDETGSPKYSDSYKNEEDRSADRKYGAVQGRSPKSGKSEKSDKKKKSDEDYPPGQ